MGPEGAALGGRTPSTLYPAAWLERQDLLEPRTQRHATQRAHQDDSLCYGIPLQKNLATTEHLLYRTPVCYKGDRRQERQGKGLPSKPSTFGLPFGPQAHTIRKGGPPTRTGCGITFCLHMEKPRLRKVARAEGTSCSFSQAPQVCTHEGLGVSQPRPVSPSPSCRATNAAGSVASAAPFPDTYEHLVSKHARSRGSRWRRKNRVREQGPGDSTQATRGWKQWPHLPPQL